MSKIMGPNPIKLEEELLLSWTPEQLDYMHDVPYWRDIHQSGKWYTDDNIDQMLMERHLNKKARRSSNKNHFKGTKKRTEEDDVRFAQSFEKLLLMAQERRESE